jgi:hypothetical protein
MEATRTFLKQGHAMTVLCNEKGDIVYDTEDFAGRMHRAMERYRETAALSPIPMIQLDNVRLAGRTLMTLDSIPNL